MEMRPHEREIEHLLQNRVREASDSAEGDPAQIAKKASRLLGKLLGKREKAIEDPKEKEKEVIEKTVLQMIDLDQASIFSIDDARPLIDGAIDVMAKYLLARGGGNSEIHFEINDILSSPNVHAKIEGLIRKNCSRVIKERLGSLLDSPSYKKEALTEQMLKRDTWETIQQGSFPILAENYERFWPEVIQDGGIIEMLTGKIANDFENPKLKETFKTLFVGRSLESVFDALAENSFLIKTIAHERFWEKVHMIIGLLLEKEKTELGEMNVLFSQIMSGTYTHKQEEKGLSQQEVEALYDKEEIDRLTKRLIDFFEPDEESAQKLEKDIKSRRRQFEKHDYISEDILYGPFLKVFEQFGKEKALRYIEAISTFNQQFPEQENSQIVQSFIEYIEQMIDVISQYKDRTNRQMRRELKEQLAQVQQNRSRAA